MARFRLMGFGVILLAGVLTAAGGKVSVRGAVIQAGVNATFADFLNVNEPEAAVEKEAGQTKKEVTADNDEAKKEKTICGYTNLGVANVDNFLNIRAEAGENAKIVGRLPAHGGCEILGTENGWYRIQSGNVWGYVRSDYILTGKDAEDAAEKYKKNIATVNTLTVYIREKPNTECTILTIVTVDEELEVVEEGKEWIKIKLDDENGYVSANYVDVSEKLKKAQTYAEMQGEASSGNASLVQTALSYVGNPYVWGGTSLTNGVDCSGFTMQIMAKYGVYLPHLASAQAGYGRSVGTSELLPGDLIFYGSGGSITHVAIYIGGGRIVHASNRRDGIKVSNAFYRTPVCCRRMF